MTKDEALKLALEALEEWLPTVPVLIEKKKSAITAIKEALAQPEQEPVAWATREDFYLELNRRVDRMREEMMIKTVTMRCKEYDLALPIVDMYGGHIVVGQVSFPPQRTWVGLTLDERIELAKDVDWPVGAYCDYAEKIESALRSKNYDSMDT